MMKLPEVLRRVRCPTCNWQAVWGPEEMLQALRQRGAMRREKEPDLELLVHLTERAARQLTCVDCRHVGLQLTPWTPDFDFEPPQRVCEACGKPIPVERLELFPQATRCAACQDRPAPASDETDYCPRCGGLVVLRLDRGSRAARYRATCSDCGWKQ
jgi:predicted RNA-binding Zn-ribbon protein involved in translation (DUF1610 family)